MKTWDPRGRVVDLFDDLDFNFYIICVRIFLRQLEKRNVNCSWPRVNERFYRLGDEFSR